MDKKFAVCLGGIARPANRLAFAGTAFTVCLDPLRFVSAVKSNPPIPVPLIVLFGISALAVIGFVIVFAPGGPKKDSAIGAIRISVVGPDGEAREGVQTLIVKNAAFRPILLPRSDSDGIVESTVPVGTHELRAYPKRLASKQAREAFLKQRAADPRALENLRMFVRTIVVQEGANEPIEARLPPKAGY